MFRNFSFQTAARHPSDIAPDTFDNDFDSMSPISYSSVPHRAYTPPIDPLESSVNDLSRQLSEQSLHQPSPCRRASSRFLLADLPTPPNEPTSPRTLSPDPYFDGIAPSSDRSSSPPYLNNSVTSIRQQRQRAVRRQCSSTHLREISELVSRMVQDRSQCSFRSPPMTPTSAPSPSCDDYLGSSMLPRRSTFASEGSDVADEDSMDADIDQGGCSSGSEDGSVSRVAKYRRANDAMPIRVGKSTVTRDARLRKHSSRKSSLY